MSIVYYFCKEWQMEVGLMILFAEWRTTNIFRMTFETKDGALHCTSAGRPRRESW
jgi:hypothetical protein